jgi:acetyl-CoA acyltransferase
MCTALIGVVPATFAFGKNVFTGVDVRWMHKGVQLRGEWITGRPFDGTTTRELAKAAGKKPRAYFRAFAVAGVPPEIMGIGPVVAIPKALAMAGLKLSDIGLIELNEAFAVQAVAVLKELGIDADRVNVNGGAVALGHAIGSSGGRVLTTLLYALRSRNLTRGIATLCLGGGNGVALAVERI